MSDKPNSGKLKVKDKINLVRDSFSKGIINTDRGGYAAVKARKRLAQQKDEVINSLNDQVIELKAAHAELYRIVHSLVKKK